VTDGVHLAPAHDGIDRLRWLGEAGLSSTPLLVLLEVEVFDTTWRFAPLYNKQESHVLIFGLSSFKDPGI
jgi:hypothetical protein